MTVVVRMEVEHFASLEMALDVLRAEQALLDRWHLHSVELGLVIENLEEIVDRYEHGVVKHLDPWSRKVTT